jgi:glucose/arabinose dehydrogenase
MSAAIRPSASTIRNLSGQPISAGPEAIATQPEVPRGIAFGPGGKLCVRTGKAGNHELAQDRSSLGATFFV